MPKGIVTQSLCLLTDGQPAVQDFRNALEKQGFEIVGERPDQVAEPIAPAGRRIGFRSPGRPKTVR